MMSGVNDWLSTEAFDVEETETYHKDAAGVPFGRMHAEWLQFKAKQQPGDLLCSFSTPRDYWQHCAGRAGYAWVRNGEIVEEFVTLMN